MFVNAIEKIREFTRPIHTVTKRYNGLIEAGTSTLFFVNDNGVAITCKHVAQLLMAADSINDNYQAFKTERDALTRNAKFKKRLSELEKKYSISGETFTHIKNTFMGCIDKMTTVDIKLHPKIDLAILIFQGFSKIEYTSYATFVKDKNKIKFGRSLCRDGYPFPEFDNFKYDFETDELNWTDTGNQTPIPFPIDGILTRFLGNAEGIYGIEMSTPGLKGQSGCPLFDKDALIYGMQFGTNHLHLGFDIKNREVNSDGKKTKVSNYPFLHVGHCVHVDNIKAFLTENNIRYYEEQ